MPSTERAGEVNEVSRPQSGVLGDKKVTIGDGAQGTQAKDNASDHKKNFAASLLAAGWSAVSVPATLLFDIGSSLLAMAGEVLKLLVELAEISERDYMDDWGDGRNALVDVLQWAVESD